ncbi:MFS transporter [Paraburkholderia sp. GAS42]|uniref:MFS transporter n=1 Tax=Paraburkholderia sp. GAS42 TaxID=3035135 RepID=UPI003D1C5D94
MATQNHTATVHGAAASTSTVSVDAVYRKLAIRTVPLILLCYFFGYLDRVNVGFAKLQMMSELNLSEAAYGIGAGLFFLGYLFLQVPAGYLVKRIGVRACLAGSMFTWGIVSILTLLTSNQSTFYAVRFLLGLTEASFSSRPSSPTSASGSRHSA